MLEGPVTTCPAAPPADALQLLDIRDLAQLLCLSIPTLWRNVSKAEAGLLPGWPPALRLGPKTIRFRRSDVQRYLDGLAGGGDHA